MKTRTGFVSNSSTCSFVICGFKISEKEYDYVNAYTMITGKTKEQIIDAIKQYDKENGRPEKEITDYDISDFCSECIECDSGSLFDDKDITIETGEGVNGVIVGQSICRIGSEGDSLDNEDYDIEETIDRVRKVRDKVGCNAPIKIFVGTKCC